MNTTFRKIEESDYEVICSFPQSAEEHFFLCPRGTFPLTPEQLKEYVDARTDSTVLLVDGEPAGFANFITAEKGESCNIGNVILNPELRGQGLGRTLIEEMCRIGVEKYQVQTMKISCFNENTAGLLLYTKLGFTPNEIVPWEKEDCSRVALIHLKKEMA